MQTLDRSVYGLVVLCLTVSIQMAGCSVSMRGGQGQFNQASSTGYSQVWGSIPEPEVKIEFAGFELGTYRSGDNSCGVKGAFDVTITGDERWQCKNVYGTTAQITTSTSDEACSIGINKGPTRIWVYTNFGAGDTGPQQLGLEYKVLGPTGEIEHLFNFRSYGEDVPHKTIREMLDSGCEFYEDAYRQALEDELNDNDLVPVTLPTPDSWGNWSFDRPAFIQNKVSKNGCTLTVDFDVEWLKPRNFAGREVPVDVYVGTYKAKRIFVGEYGARGQSVSVEFTEDSRVWSTGEAWERACFENSCPTFIELRAHSGSQDYLSSGKVEYEMPSSCRKSLSVIPEVTPRPTAAPTPAPVVERCVGDACKKDFEACSDSAKPTPHYKVLGGQCLPSCGVLGGTYIPAGCGSYGGTKGETWDAEQNKCCNKAVPFLERRN